MWLYWRSKEYQKFNLNNNSESSASLNKSSFPFRICYISLTQDQTVSIYFLLLQKYTSYVLIGSTLCLGTTLSKYSAGGYESGTDIAMHLRKFVLIAYICGCIKDRQITEYTKYQWNDKKHHGVLQWAKNSQNIIRYDNGLKLIYLIRE